MMKKSFKYIARIVLIPLLLLQLTGNLRPGTDQYQKAKPDELKTEVTDSGPEMLFGISGTSHFIPVWTDNPYQPMAILISSAYVLGYDLPVGSEIGIFDLDSLGNTVCVGAGKLDSPVTSGNPMLLVASTDDPTTEELDGFTPGNQMIFHVWDSVSQLEYTNVVLEINPSLDTVFTSLGTAFVEVSAYAHYKPVWTGSAYQPMIVNVVAANLSGNPLIINNEIGVFDMDGLDPICVGSGIVDSAFLNGDTLGIIVSADNPTTTDIDGYIAGNTINFQIWDTTAQQNHTNINTIFNTGYDTEFTHNGSAFVGLSLDEPLPCSISSTSLPYIQGFEAIHGVIQYGGTICGPNFYWTYENDHPGQGRASYGVQSPIVNSGNGALTLDRTPFGETNINAAILTLNMANYSQAEGGIQLSFSWAHHNETADTNDKVWIRGSVYDQWLEIYSIDPTTAPAQHFTQVSDLDIISVLTGATPPQQTSGTFQVKFGQEGMSPTSSDGITYDDIKIEEVSLACPAPTSQFEKGIKATEAELHWTENGSSTSWEIKLGVKGFNPSGASVVTVTINPHTWSGLTKNTSYDWYIRADCSGGNFSGWTGPHTFKTKPCNLSTASLPYAMGFESMNGIVQQNVSLCGPTFYWSFETDFPGQGRARFGNTALMVQNGNGAVTLDRTPTGDATINSIILTINLSNYTSSSDLDLSFWYGDHSDESDANDKVWVRESDDFPWVELFDLDPGNASDDTFQQISGLDIDDALSSASQTVGDYTQIRFSQKGSAQTSFDGITFDDILLEEAVPSLNLMTGGGESRGEGEVMILTDSDVIIIKSSGEKALFEKEVWVYDMFGREVHHSKLLPSGFDKIELKTKGYHIVRVLSGNLVTTEKVIIR